MQSKTSKFTLGLAAVCLVLSGCASLPMTPAEPAVTFVNFKSVNITPAGLKFEVKMLVKNQMGLELPITGMDYRFDLNDQQFLTGQYDKLGKLSGGQQKTVVLPFTLSWEALAKQALHKDGCDWYTASFNGNLHVDGDLPFKTIPFEIRRVMQIPLIPTVTFAGTEGNPVSGKFTIKLKINNVNHFSINLKNVNTTLVMNGTSYDALQSEDDVEWGENQTQLLRLSMENSPVKGLSMLGNLVANRGATDLKLKGSLTFETEFGDWEVPFEVGGQTN
jgi:LEA14-like dessication related protein